jgi:predicted protein tyrosine phosphatase
MTLQLIVSPLSQLDATWRAHQPSHVIGMLSPTSVHPALEGHAAACRLILEFNDINVPQEGLTAPDLAMVSSLLEFAQGWDGKAPLLIHCWAGISRSTAAAFIVACARMPHLAEDDIADQLRAASPMATPNRLMVELADGLLGRDGRMVEAIDRIGRGDDAAEGVVFELRV